MNTGGFDVVDPAYRLFFSNFTLTGSDAEVRFLDIPISVQVPTDIVGLSFGMQLKGGLSLSSTFLHAGTGSGRRRRRVRAGWRRALLLDRNHRL